MGLCISSSRGLEASTTEVVNVEIEKLSREVSKAQAPKFKVLLLGSGDSGKTTVLKHLRLLYRQPFSPQEVESCRQLIFDSVTRGMKCLLDAMGDMDLRVSDENGHYLDLMSSFPDLRDGEPFPMSFYQPLKSLWEDLNVQKAWEFRNEAALPDNLSYFFPSLDRLFHPSYVPEEQDIIRCSAQTLDVTETVFDLHGHDMAVVDVGGQRSERKRWIHYIEDARCILFLVSLSGYDECLIEDMDVNRMHDAMALWDGICHGRWFTNTSIVLLLNKNDLFEQKIQTSDIKYYFPDFTGKAGDAPAGREYFKDRFVELARDAGRLNQNEVYIHVITATNTAMLQAVMIAVEGSIIIRANAGTMALL